MSGFNHNGHGCGPYREVSGPSTAAVKPPKKLCSEQIVTELEKEHRTLVQLRSAVQQQLKVLQAEEVTIRRLIRHHSDSNKLSDAKCETRSHSQELERESAQEPVLPQLDLDVLVSAADRCADVSEEENESDISE